MQQTDLCEGFLTWIYADSLSHTNPRERKAGNHKQLTQIRHEGWLYLYEYHWWVIYYHHRGVIFHLLSLCAGKKAEIPHKSNQKVSAEYQTWKVSIFEHSCLLSSKTRVYKKYHTKKIDSPYHIHVLNSRIYEFSLNKKKIEKVRCVLKESTWTTFVAWLCSQDVWGMFPI